MRGIERLHSAGDLLGLLPLAYLRSFDWNYLVLHDPCVYCNETFPCSRDATDPQLRANPQLWQGIEHVLPRSRGGSNTWENKVSACYWCNVQRANTGLLRYLLARLAAAAGDPPRAHP